MGLCYSSNREYRKLINIKPDTVEKRTFAGLTKMVRLNSIYDGDTFKIIARHSHREPYHEYSIRLSGIDAPEVKPNSNTPHQALHKLAGIAVRNYLTNKYPAGTIFYVDFEKEEKYGRLLGTVWTTRKLWWGLGPIVKDINLCEDLLTHGLVLPYGGATKVEFDQTCLEQILSKAIN